MKIAHIICYSKSYICTKSQLYTGSGVPLGHKTYVKKMYRCRSWASGPQNCVVSWIDIDCYCARARTATQYYVRLMQHDSEAETIYSTWSSVFPVSVLRKSIKTCMSRLKALFTCKLINVQGAQDGRPVQTMRRIQLQQAQHVYCCGYGLNAKIVGKCDFSPYKVLYRPEVEVTPSFKNFFDTTQVRFDLTKSSYLRTPFWKVRGIPTALDTCDWACSNVSTPTQGLNRFLSSMNEYTHRRVSSGAKVR